MTTHHRLPLVIGFIIAGAVGVPGLRAQDAPATDPAAHATAPAENHPEEHPADTQSGHPAHPAGHAHEHAAHVPSLAAVTPFVLILLCIALLPLIHKTEHWWHHNKNKLLVSAVLAVITLAYYLLRGVGFGHGEHAAAAGVPTVLSVLSHAVLDEYIPFIVLLFSLYTICGGIQLRGDLKAKPITNTAFLACGAVMASFVGTTGASMLLIRPLLQTNQERKYVKHTVIFFIFLVSNIGGCLLPIGDPPLFLGYLKGVPFPWTLNLWVEWLFCSVVILAIYFVWDTAMYKKEPPLEHMLDELRVEPLRIRGSLNFLWLIGVVLAVALIVPNQKLRYTNITIPDGHYFVREVVMIFLVVIAWLTSSPRIREENKFDFFAITEVAVLFIGIFICMQVPVEILKIKGGDLGLTTPTQFFWATGMLSSFLDNAPTYVVFFETADAMTPAAGPGVLTLLDGSFINESLLVAISLGAVFMGANTYIGNGPNFMVKSIAEQAGVKMPSFFGYMAYSVGILIPVFIAITFIFLRGH